jgi:hypothetical protein
MDATRREQIAWDRDWPVLLTCFTLDSTATVSRAKLAQARELIVSTLAESTLRRLAEISDYGPLRVSAHVASVVAAAVYVAISRNTTYEAVEDIYDGVIRFAHGLNNGSSL